MNEIYIYRYDELESTRALELPSGALPMDFSVAELAIKEEVFDPARYKPALDPDYLYDNFDVAREDLEAWWDKLGFPEAAREIFRRRIMKEPTFPGYIRLQTQICRLLVYRQSLLKLFSLLHDLERIIAVIEQSPFPDPRDCSEFSTLHLACEAASSSWEAMYPWNAHGFCWKGSLLRPYLAEMKRSHPHWFFMGKGLDKPAGAAPAPAPSPRSRLMSLKLDSAPGIFDKDTLAEDLSSRSAAAEAWIEFRTTEKNIESLRSKNTPHAARERDRERERDRSKSNVQIHNYTLLLFLLDFFFFSCCC